MLSWGEGILLIVGGLFLCTLVATVVLLVIWIRSAKPGPNKSIAIGCGVVFLIGLVLVSLMVGLSFVWFSLARSTEMHKAEAQQQSAKEEMVRRHQQQKIEREEATKEVQ